MGMDIETNIILITNSVELQFVNFNISFIEQGNLVVDIA